MSSTPGRSSNAHSILATRRVSGYPAACPGLQDLFDQRQHTVLIEAAFTQVGVFPPAQFQLPGAFRRSDVDPSRLQAVAVIRPMLVLDDVKPALAVLKPFFDEGHQDAIFLVLRVEECADVARTLQRLSSERHVPSWGHSRPQNFIEHTRRQRPPCSQPRRVEESVYGSDAVAREYGNLSFNRRIGASNNRHDGHASANAGAAASR